MTDPTEILESVPLTGKPRIIAAALVASFPKPLHGKAILDALYSRKSGPAFLAQAVSNPVRYLRPRLERVGWTIPDARRGGYRLERLA